MVRVLSVLLLAASPAFALRATAGKAVHADVAGNWRVEFAVPTGEMTVNMTINQKGATLTGQVVNEDGEFPLRGTIDGDEVTATWTVAEQGARMDITMKGKVDGETINGVARLGNVGEGTLSARRVSRNP